MKVKNQEVEQGDLNNHQSQRSIPSLFWQNKYLFEIIEVCVIQNRIDSISRISSKEKLEYVFNKYFSLNVTITMEKPSCKWSSTGTIV